MANLTVEKQNKVAIVSIENPQTFEMWETVLNELGDVFDAFTTDQAVTAIILTQIGQKSNLGNTDTIDLPIKLNYQNLLVDRLQIYENLDRIDACSKPTIAVLNSNTFAGDCELALACDLRIAEEHTFIGLPEIKFGILPGGGGTQRLPRLVGVARAKELMFTGDPISAEEAKQIGLLNRVVPVGRGLEAALELAEKISRYSVKALSSIKKAVDEGISVSLNEGLDREAMLFEDVIQSKDYINGILVWK